MITLVKGKTINLVRVEGDHVGKEEEDEPCKGEEKKKNLTEWLVNTSVNGKTNLEIF